MGALKDSVCFDTPPFDVAQALTDQVKAGGSLSADDLASLEADAAALEAMGKDPENPV